VKLSRPLLLLIAVGVLPLASLADPPLGNRPDRLEWFQDQGFGLFIHWSVDSQLGVGISHSLVGASDDYVNRFFGELPGTFNPRGFHPEDWAALAKLAGVRYVVFTAKHHSGFCMFPTRTTDFGIMATPFHRDIVGEVLGAFRAQGIAAGLYFSPDDFWWLHRHGVRIQREVPEVLPSNLPGLLAYDKAQVTELLTHYGPIDLIFFDGEATDLRNVAWTLQPNIVVTRGAIPTPEQTVPGRPMPGPWESNLTMGHAWQYQPTDDRYKSGRECISLLVETRAKGGNLLLDIGPKPDGTLAIEQEERLREMALWMFVNGECIHGVRPWIVTNEGDNWFTRAKDSDTLYVIVKGNQPWPYGQWREVVLKSVRAGPGSEVSVLGESGKTLEYRPNVVPAGSWREAADGLHLRAMMAQRLRDDRSWSDPVVLKVTHVTPALVPPEIDTTSAEAGPPAAVFTADVTRLGDVPSLQVGFEYRDVTGQDVHERVGPWIRTEFAGVVKPGSVRREVTGLAPDRTYEVRAVALHPLLNFYGQEITLRTP
jgi:alpha-L-fucosidase